MKKEEKEMYLAASPIGYWSALNGLEVKAIDGDYLVIAANVWAYKGSVHRLKMHYSFTQDDYYIVLGGSRWWLKDCLRA